MKIQPKNKQPEIDWKEVRQRVDAALQAIEKGWTPPPDEKKKILKARAIALAREPKKEALAQPIEVLEFLLAYERYSIESSFVREVHPMKEFTSLPCTPSFVFGIINVRGRVVSVIDIKKFYELPEKGLTDLNKVILVHNNLMEFGILADEIVGVRSVSVEEIQPPPATFTGIRTLYLKGVTSEGLVILDMEKMLSDPRMIVDEKVET